MKEEIKLTKEQFDLLSSDANYRENNFACPNCGKELWDTNPTVLLTSYPPRKQISCIECGYAGTRLV